MFNSVPQETFFRVIVIRISPGRFRVVKSVCVANALVRHQFEIFATEGVTAPRREICERHLMRAADLSVRVVNLPGKNRSAEAILPSHPDQETLDKSSLALHEAPVKRMVFPAMILLLQSWFRKPA